MPQHRVPARPSRVVRAVLSGTLVCAVAPALALAGSASPAEAAVKTTKYAFYALGYGTSATAGQVALRSAPTAYSVMGCTRAAGLTRTNNLAQSVTGQSKVVAARSEQRTYLTKAGDTVLTSSSTAASATLGSSALGIRITGLRSVATASATKKGRLHASSTFTFADITPVGPLVLPYPLDQPASVILKQLATKGPITIPGVGILRLGAQEAATNATTARATGTGLQVHLFGADLLNRTADDSDVVLIRTYARLNKAATRGVFTGGPWGVDASAAGGLAAVGRNPSAPLPCEGTGGRVVSSALAGLDLASRGQLDVNGLRNRIYGRQGVPKKGQTGWTESTIADVNLAGVLRVNGVRALAKVVRTKNGRVATSSTQHIGSLSVNGTKRAAPSPGQSFVIPGVAKVEVPKPVRSATGIRVTALRITLLGGTAVRSVINLGNAEVNARYR